MKRTRIAGMMFGLALALMGLGGQRKPNAVATGSNGGRSAGAQGTFNPGNQRRFRAADF